MNSEVFLVDEETLKASFAALSAQAAKPHAEANAFIGKIDEALSAYGRPVSPEVKFRGSPYLPKGPCEADEMVKIVELDGVPLPVSYSYGPGTPATFDDPGDSGWCEIHSVFINGEWIEASYMSKRYIAILCEEIAHHMDNDFGGGFDHDDDE